jgi:GT2 family glycosyltransferase
VEVSCVILSFNSERCIGKCLDALAETFERLGISQEIWVVENGSTDGSLEIVESKSRVMPSIRIIRSETNLGTTVSRNLALRQCKGKRILVLDSDAYVDATALKVLIEELDHDESVGLVAPKLIFPDGRPQLSTDQFPTIPRKVERVVRLRQIEKCQIADCKTDVDYAISACWLFKKELLDEVGLLDEKIFYAPEDAEYCLRVWSIGYRIVYVPSATVVHDAQEKSRRLLPNRFVWLHLAGLIYHFRKHRYAFSAKRIRKRFH